MIETIINAGVTGIGAGIGTSIGSYLATKAVIKHLDKIEAKLREAK